MPDQLRQGQVRVEFGKAAEGGRRGHGLGRRRPPHSAQTADAQGAHQFRRPPKFVSVESHVLPQVDLGMLLVRVVELADRDAQ